MQKTVHEIHAAFTNPNAKSRLLFCTACEVKTMHTTPFFGYPFRCAANHDMITHCDGCKTYVDFIAKVVVNEQHECKRYCMLCCKPDSEEKRNKLEQRKAQAKQQSPELDANDPESIARFFGASSFSKK